MELDFRMWKIFLNIVFEILKLTKGLNHVKFYFISYQVNIIEPVSFLNDVCRFWNGHINDVIYSDLMKKLFIDAR